MTDKKNDSYKRLKTSLRFLNRIKGLFSVHCPSCKGIMWSATDESNNIVWTCENCREQWI